MKRKKKFKKIIGNCVCLCMNKKRIFIFAQESYILYLYNSIRSMYLHTSIEKANKLPFDL